MLTSGNDNELTNGIVHARVRWDSNKLHSEKVDGGMYYDEPAHERM